MSTLSIAVLVPRGLPVGVATSQIGGVTGMLRRSGFDVDVFTHTSDCFPFESFKYRSVLRLSHDVMGNYDLVYIRSCLDNVWCLLFRTVLRRGTRILYDFRGLAWAEARFTRGRVVRAIALWLFERLAYGTAYRLHFVSNRMRSLLFESWGSRERCDVIPCCVESVHVKSRSANPMGWRFVYVGGLSGWQNFEQIVAYHRRIGTQLSDATLDVYTADVDEANRMLKAAGFPQNAQSVAHSDLLQRLRGYDFGYLFREDNIVNNVASPIKFIEYTSCGVIPIVTHGIGDYSRDAFEHRIGLLVDMSGTHVDVEAAELCKLRADTGIYRRLADYSSQFLWDRFDVSND